MLMIRTKVLRGENIEKVIKARLEKLFFSTSFCRSRSQSMPGFKTTIFGMISVSLDVRIVNTFVYIPSQ